MRSWGLVCACLALGASLIEAEPGASTSALASIKIHRRHHQSRQESHTKHRYEIKGVKSEVDAILAAARGRIDVRSVQVLQSGEEGSPSDVVVLARVYAEDGDILTLAPHSESTVSNGHVRRGKRHSHSHSSVTVTKGEYDEESLIAQDRAEVAACLDETEGYLDELRDGEVSLYTDSAFFDCFRPYDQVFAYFDLLTEQNPDIMTKFPNASVTFEGRPIPAYRLSSPSATTSPKKALYTQSLIHAREWQSGSSSFYTVSSLIDDLRADNEEAKQILDEFDWYFVPIVNIDGYKYAWEVDRMWRTNRDLMSEDGHFVPGVDLNRNFGPDEFFNLNPDDVDEETHPGDYPLSEPSTAGLFEFITGIDGMSGIVDMHTFGGQVLRPFSNQKDPPPEPYGSKMVALSDSVRDALSTREGVQYVSEPGGYLYEAFGCFDDGMFLAYNYTVPALTIEVEGLDFMVSQSTIRPVGENIDKGLRRFAREVSAYSSFVADYLS